MRGLAKRPLDPRGRHVDGVLAQVLAQDFRDAGAQRVVDAVRVVDVDDEPLGAGELDGEDFHAGQIVLDARADLVLELPFFLECRRHRSLSQKKWARGAHSAEPVKMVGRV